ncbi:MAG TPA: penicillin-binding transpeptidase domain-containing protein [Candidatus Binatia bacterium]|jgi:cell division protein FtsI (penicillin-binding protein 3)|nr:penicillin-binding transpeptidase domain-containing protein [Candidatus Binatia bacterium]
MKARLLVAGGAVGVGLLLVLGRLVQFTVVQSEQLARQAASQHSQRLTFTPRRGAILDRNGELLALSIPAESLFVRPRKLPADVVARVPALAEALHTSTLEVNATLHSPAPFVWLKRQATPQEAAQVRALELAGIDSFETQRRFYPHGTLAAPLIGFTNIDARGLEGVERVYDDHLRGESAEVVQERDALGRPILAQGAELPPEALNVRLTLDLGLQYLAQRTLEQAVQTTRARAGTVVMLDPQTFAVLALAQVPTFDPNEPQSVPDEARRNPAISDPYEPGSTMKVLLAAAALDMNLVRPEDQIFCELGHYQVGKHTIHDHHPYGWLSFAQVLQHSSNICAAKVGERLGKETYQKYLRRFGLGQKTGIDLPAESPGLLAPPPNWSRINLVTASFGQGVAVTPLQLASAYAALANDGVFMRPYVVQEVLRADGTVVMANSPQRRWQVVRSETAHLLLQLLEKVVGKEGTGWRARIPGVRVAGKTGTSQKVNQNGGYSAHGRIASFIGIVPADRPRLVILVSIDEPKTGVYGGEIAAPVFQVIAQHALAQLGITGDEERPVPPAAPTPVVLTTTPSSPQRAPDRTGTAPQVATLPVGGPSFLGMSLREAMLTARRNGWRVSASGSGYVIDQIVQNDPETQEPRYVLTLAPTTEKRP